MTIEDHESANVSPSSNVHANRIFEPNTNGQNHGQLELSLETTATTSPVSPDGLDPDPLKTSSFTHSVPTPFPYPRIHQHCLNCIRPLRCIRKPAFAIVSNTTGGGPAVSANGLTTEEIFALILNVNFYQNGLLPLDVDGQLDHCPVVRCPNDVCPMLLHYCKLPEHFLLCHHQKIPCLNAAYGCPYTILRKDIATHLQHCPANVVHCSAEWNRWPLHTTEKSPQTRVYCPPQALDIRNLDVALALRDQRMLKQLWSASRQMKRIMRGCLSTHPAVPIKPYIGVRTHREFGTTTTTNSDPNSSSEGIGQSATTPEIIHHDEERYIAYAHQLVDTAYHESLVEILKRTALVYRKAYDHQRALVTGPNGVQYQGRQKSNSVCQMTLGGQPISITNTLASSAAASMGQSSSSINLPILSDSIVQSVLEVNGGGSGGHSDGSTEEQQPTCPPPPPPVPKCNALSLEVSIRSLAAYQPKPRSMYTFRCGADYRVDEIAAHHRDIHSDIHGGLDGWIEHRCPLFQYGCSFVHRRWAPTTAGERKTLVYNEGLEAFACSSSFDEEEDGDSTQMTELSATATASSKTSRKRGGSSSSSTSLDPDSTCSRRSSTVTTTTCCSGSSGGPTSSSKKYCSTMSLLSATSSSLCSTPVTSSSSTPATSPCSGCCPGPGLLTVPMSIPPPQFGIISVQYSLNDFPFEILQHICNYLDGYTLNNLSFASQRLRLVVQSFLKKKGYVLLQWKRYETEKGKYRWKVAYKKWLFSTAIAPITDWTMDSDNVIAEHLRVCPFNDRVEHGPEPFQCIFLNADSTVMMKRQRP